MDFRKTMKRIALYCETHQDCLSRKDCPMLYIGDKGTWCCRLEPPYPDQWNIDQICEAAEKIVGAAKN